jgi:hypothetical protein
VIQGTTDGPGTAREEAERLVAAALATVSVAASRVGYHVAEDCGCPLCRAIMVLREPDPRIAERLASGAADLAAGLAGLLGALHDAAVSRGAQAEPGCGGAEHPQRLHGGAQAEPGCGGAEHPQRLGAEAQAEPGRGGAEHPQRSAGRMR